MRRPRCLLDARQAYKTTGDLSLPHVSASRQSPIMPPQRRTYRIPRSTPRTLSGEIIGRTALAILGLAFLVGGYKCIRTAIAIERDFDQRASHTFGYTRSSSGAGLPLVAGGVLLLI